MQKLDLDTFGEIIDEILEESHVQMVIDMPEGTQNVTIKDNIGAGPVLQFYVTLRAFEATFRGFRDLLKEGADEGFIDALLKMVKDSLMEEAQNEK